MHPLSFFYIHSAREIKRDQKRAQQNVFTLCFFLLFLQRKAEIKREQKRAQREQQKRAAAANLEAGEWCSLSECICACVHVFVAGHPSFQLPASELCHLFPLSLLQPLSLAASSSAHGSSSSSNRTAELKGP